ncbi:hypothetical protein BU23DRAFT_337031 [Bimuria novae-zelandiae CBS 107.79]|uniref:Transmembrane protein n=1 Tax=Bimuria novae-zelandiae CBS 107.79 TaxID=1447943 RepID=A0A6A5ULQ4_9PLEO|nr:hypothetical protein BU23DRAFT_337031 [Bimuria novae-zelandiae CBS 107.79]
MGGRVWMMGTWIELGNVSVVLMGVCGSLSMMRWMSSKGSAVIIVWELPVWLDGMMIGLAVSASEEDEVGFAVVIEYEVEGYD